MIDKEKIIKEIEKEEHKVVKSIRNNPWIAVSIVLGILIIVLLIITFKGGVSVKAISSDDASKKLIDFTKSQGLDATFVSVSTKGDLYEVILLMNGKDVPVYITKDGESLIPSLIPLTENPVMGNNAANSNNANVPKDVEKSNKPVVEAFIFSYCPYGLQFEKALFPVYDLLKDKADINIVAIGAMHGEYERIETLRQISIEQLYGKDKLFAYLKEFNANTDIGSCSGDDVCLNKYLPSIYKKLFIDKTKVENYMKSDAPKIYDKQNARANELGISGSPTFVINGVQVQVNRDSNSIKEAVCNAFINKPNECAQSLSTQAASPGFG
ncbi:MAG: DsbA family protein [Nanoarchaeota archaeon]